MLLHYMVPTAGLPPPAIAPIWMGTEAAMPPPTSCIQTWLVRVSPTSIGLTWDELETRIEQEFIGWFA